MKYGISHGVEKVAGFTGMMGHYSNLLIELGTQTKG